MCIRDRYQRRVHGERKFKIATMSFQTVESKKEEFRKYLERSGVIDQLTRVLVTLYEEPEKPQNAIEFLKKYLGSPTDIDVETMKIEYDRLRDENTRLRRQEEAVSYTHLTLPTIYSV
eukprot:TRINITY_DN6670_c0_g1_i3.p1 TRINITY_DN6670_c0_g1~~TRINITY_DN6670_c0_g1_i3.p1  ORF type:complete len:138 (-),score=52.72 TRINITY_DN6670_c0_g1_i3:36-389(-)